MNTAVVAERIGVLEQLAAGRDRPKAAQLREIIETVEAAIAQGVTHAVLVRALADTGLVFTLGSFRTTLARIRRSRRLARVDLQVENARDPQPSAAAHEQAQTAMKPGGSMSSGVVTDSAALEIPGDWLTSLQLTRDQIKKLAPDQRVARRKMLDQAIRETYFRSPYAGLKLGEGQLSGTDSSR